MLAPAIRFVAAKGSAKAQTGSIQLLCRVKPGVSAGREGIVHVSGAGVELCVAAQARAGEANRAVCQVIAEALKVPKSDIHIAKGTKTREKTVMIKNITEDPAEAIECIKIMLQESATR
ncbi:DUF167 domain protein [Massariosphaeria phaeospora]|uniref:DUF167 domain protein n=1 Tax=Massariosphaeria phaeospora TaxID=100035 RepID=A0A7C8MEZ1_9PLEO|nr:DUF167 domain protein [Massariosphaeria phaeospora]